MSDTIDGLKQRLVGAFVILSLAIIFVPMVFDKPHTTPKSTIADVPARPDFEPVVIKKTKQPEFKVVDVDPADNKVKSVDQIKKKPLANAKVVVKKKPSTKKSQAASQKNGAEVATLSKPKVSHLPIFKNVWMVQLGTFSQAKNAYKLRDQLRADGFDGHTKEIKVKGKKAIRVFSGPFVNRQDARRIKKRLDTKYKVDSLVIFFDA